MKLARIASLTPLVCLLLTSSATAEESSQGEVRLPLAKYRELTLGASGTPNVHPSHAIRELSIDVKIDPTAKRNAATITATFRVAAGNAKRPIALLPALTAVQNVTVGGSSAALAAEHGVLYLTPPNDQSHQVVVSYQADRSRRETASAILLPIPGAARAALSVTVQNTDAEIVVAPALSSSRRKNGNNTVVGARLPATEMVEVLWREAQDTPLVLSRAKYRGVLTGDAVVWTASYDATLSGGESNVALLPKAATLRAVRVDGRAATIVRDGKYFSTNVSGRGRHRIDVEFESSVERGKGPPTVDLSLVEVPVSRIELSLPGKKRLSVSPAANVRSRFASGRTVATVHIPMRSRVKLTWVESVPSATDEAVRANASVSHVLKAEEGVLHARAFVDYEITRGETSRVELTLPLGVQINKVHAADASISDWRADEDRRHQKLTVFLNRKVSGLFRFEIAYEVLAKDADESSLHHVPIARVLGTHRQRGMLTLVRSEDFSLKPTQHKAVSRVGENQLPAHVRAQIKTAIGHTYKYSNHRTAKLDVQAVAPERREAKFEASVDTLASVSDVMLHATGVVRLATKAGSMETVRLGLPKEATVLAVSAPSKRTHVITPEGDVQWIDVHFTQPMEGDLEVDIEYEAPLNREGDAHIVPLIKVKGADPEQGRVAVEALTAVEVEAAPQTNLSSLDVNALPEQLLLKTRHPIRLAYRYVEVDPRPQLGLLIKRHRAIETQIASIDEARHRTLLTKDGVRVTSAQFVVRNSRKQFLRVCLPKEADIWSVFVDGKPEKPALAEDQRESCSGQDVLIKVINSTSGFPVELVYRERTEPLGGFGSIAAGLPAPDMVVTKTRWDVYLPAGLTYELAKSNMTRSDRAPLEAPVAATAQSRAHRVDIPLHGTRLSFDKLYANESEAQPFIEVDYASDGLDPRSWISLGFILALAAGVGGWLAWKRRAARVNSIG